MHDLLEDFGFIAHLLEHCGEFGIGEGTFASEEGFVHLPEAIGAFEHASGFGCAGGPACVGVEVLALHRGVAIAGEGEVLDAHTEVGRGLHES